MWVGAKNVMWGRKKFPVASSPNIFDSPQCPPSLCITFSHHIFLAALFRQAEPIDMISWASYLHTTNFLSLHSPLPPNISVTFSSGWFLLLLIRSTWTSFRTVLKLLNPKECWLFLFFCLCPWLNLTMSTISFFSKCNPTPETLSVIAEPLGFPPAGEYSVLCLLCWFLLLHLPCKWWGKHPVLSSALFCLHRDFTLPLNTFPQRSYLFLWLKL